MALTLVEDIARYVLSLMASPAPLPLVAGWVNFRLAELAGLKRLHTYRRVRELSTPAPYSTGTVTATRGSPNVTGVGSVWIAGHAGWYFRSATTWYRVANASSITLTLESDYAEEDVAGASYTLVQRYHPLPLDTQTFDSNQWVFGRTGDRLTYISQTELTLMDGSRYYTQGGLPGWLTETEPHVSGARQVEIFPYSPTSELFYYLCWIRPPALPITGQLPPFVNPTALCEGVKVDALFYDASHEREVATKQVLLNEHRRQITYWDGKRHEALLMEQGTSDSQFMVQTLARRRGRVSHDIITAYDQVWRN